MSPLIEKMRSNRIPEAVISTFQYYYELLKKGDTGFINESDIEPVTKSEIPDYASLNQNIEKTEELLQKTVILKLNGGLGTTMGLESAKSLIPVKNDLTFLDITALQIIKLREQYDRKIPLLLMNSFRTEQPSALLLSRYPQLKTSLPQSFIQNKYPRILVSDLSCVSNPTNPDLEWNPPGHGDIYTSLVTSGMLEKLLQSGYRYAFISNIDNLGAYLDIAILNYVASERIPFLMEVTDRTWMDRKGGHLARLKKNNRLILRESSQCPPEALDYFQNIERYSFFNTNNLWLNLESLKQLLDKTNGTIGLPIIRNRKHLNPVDKTSPEVFQIETAMGAAISIFENAKAIRVPRTRFAPVKNCEDLLLLWSDRFVLNNQYHITPNPHCSSRPISIKLDPEFYAWMNQLQERFPYGAPSLCDCDLFTVKGNVTFGKNVQIKGHVVITSTTGSLQRIPDNTCVSSDLHI